MIDMDKYSDIGPRILSAAVLIAVALLAFSMGGLWAAVFVAAASGIMLWEFARLTKFNPFRYMVVMVSAGVSAVLVTFQFPWWVGGLILLIGALGLYRPNRREWVLSALGLLYIGGATLALYSVFLSGKWNLLWLVVVVILSDIGGYFAGRTFGGPKLWPAISPKKTWSGTLGGWGLSVVAGIVTAIFTQYELFFAILVCLALTIASQAGDLLESWVKRKQGVKDASNLIPGHGGFLDRFDALLAASLLFVAIPGI